MISQQCIHEAVRAWRPRSEALATMTANGSAGDVVAYRRGLVTVMANLSGHPAEIPPSTAGAVVVDTGATSEGTRLVGAGTLLSYQANLTCRGAAP